MRAALAPLTLHLRAGARLDRSAPDAREPADRYRYPTPTANTGLDFLGVEHWGEPPVPDGTVTYTTPRLARDVEIFGDGSANVWVSSTASDTDLQLTLTEVRPDGQETYVQNGWLRLSHRKLDPTQSTPLRPVHTHLRRDAQKLEPGTPVLARIQIEPVDHVFRAGSAIRLSIDAPGGWFQILPTPATNTVHHERGMDSTLVLGWLPQQTAHAPLPACGTLLNQPCRASRRAVPDGTLELPPVVSLQLGTPRRLTGTTRVFTVAVQARGAPVTRALVVLRDARGRTVAASRRVALGTRRTIVRLVVRRRLRAGRYTLGVTARSSEAQIVSARKPVRVRR
jgi:hypothetical protein